MVKTGIRLLILLLLFIGSFFLFDLTKSAIERYFGNSVETTQQLVITEITQMGKLELVKYSFKDIVEQKISRDFLPDPKALLIVHGEAIGCIDLTKIEAKHVSIEADTLYIQLPEPEVCTFKIDHQKSHIYQTEYAFMNEKLLLDEAYRRAEKQIYDSAITSGILPQTKESAKKILLPFLETVSGKKVIFK
ncbi:MAG: DUF4230 domain-containing protein [Spirosomataceae bacterium]